MCWYRHTSWARLMSQTKAWNLSGDGKEVGPLPPTFKPYATTRRQLLVILNKKMPLDFYAILVIVKENINIMVKTIV